jgi:hypothetical protein
MLIAALVVPLGIGIAQRAAGRSVRRRTGKRMVSSSWAYLRVDKEEDLFEVAVDSDADLQRDLYIKTTAQHPTKHSTKELPAHLLRKPRSPFNQCRSICNSAIRTRFVSKS